MKPAKVYLTNTYVDLFQLHTSSTTASSRLLLTLSYHLIDGDTYEIWTRDLLYNIQYKRIKPLC